MRVLITGGAGYIGSHAARTLARRGHEVQIYDNLSTGHRFLAEGFPLTVGEIGDAARLAGSLHSVDAVMHFAAHSLVAESTQNPRKYFENNDRDGLVLLNTVVECGIRAFVFSSTAAVYGMPARCPITEDTPKDLMNPYGISKLFFEYALQSYERAYGVRSVSLRYFNAAGCDPGGDIGELHQPETHLIPNALAAALDVGPQLQIFGHDYPTPDGTCIRDYIHVEDLAEGHALALEYLAGGGHSDALNLGRGEGSSVKEVVETVEAVTGRPVPKRIAARRAGDPPLLVADPTRAQKVLGWKASRSLREMIASAWKFQLRRRTAARFET